MNWHRPLVAGPSGALRATKALGFALASTFTLLFFPALPARSAPGEFVEPEVELLHQIEGDAGLGLFGWAVSELRDVDDDGAMEAITGAPFNSIGGAQAGRAYVFSGATGAPLFTFTGQAGSQLGYAIADAGDVDDDGFSDIIVGAPGGGEAGHAFVFSGADGETIGTLTGASPGDAFGAAVSGAGDLDGDGVADLLVGAPSDSSLFANGGRLYAFSGVDLSSLWIREGDAAGGSLGSAAAALGDVDRDGSDEVLAGASGNGGAILVLKGTDGADLYPPLLPDPGGNGNLGSFFAGGLGDLDDDGSAEIYGGDYGDNSNGKAAGKAYVWSGATGERLFTFTGGAAGDGLGCGRGGGDADHDGTLDIAVGSYSSSAAGAMQGGFVTVFSGADGSVIRTISGTTPGEQLGFDVVTLGDVNGDKRDDLVIAAANDNRIYIVAGLPENDGTDTDTDTGSTSGADTDTTTDSSTATDTHGDTDTGAGEADTTSATGATAADDDTDQTDETGAATTSSQDGGAGCGCSARDGGEELRGLLGTLLRAGLLGLGLGRRRRA